MKAIPKTAITEKQLRRMVRDVCMKNASLSDWAKSNGITPQQASAFLAKTQTAGLKIPAAFGFRPQVIYIPLDEPLISTPIPPRNYNKKPATKKEEKIDRKKLKEKRRA